MTQSNIKIESNSQTTAKPNPQRGIDRRYPQNMEFMWSCWFHYVTLAALAQAWTLSTTLALICALFWVSS